MSISQFYYINLDRRKDRLKHISHEIRKSKILTENIQKYSGVDGRQLNLLNVPEYILNKKSIKTIESKKIYYFGVSLTYGSLACAMSHYDLFTRCAKNNNGNILILEDDACIPNDIDNYIEQINYCKITYDIFYLGIHINKKSTKYVKISNNIFRLTGKFWGAYAYVLTPRACNYIIKNVFPIYYQFDTEINNHVNNNNLTALYFGFNVVKSGHFVSDNQGQNGLINQQKNSQDLWLDLFI